MTTSGYLVEGMTCGSCVAGVLEKIRSLSGSCSLEDERIINEGGLSFASSKRIKGIRA